jgi:nucleotide-binding universal stress UspA family protein
MKRRVVVPVRPAETPGAAHGGEALHAAEQLARELDADLHLVAVVDSADTLRVKAPSVGTAGAPPSHGAVPRWVERQRHEAERTLDVLRARIVDDGFAGDVTCEVRAGWPSEEIPAVAEGDQTVAVVMPTAVGGASDGFTPEVAQAVVSHVDVPSKLVALDQPTRG